MNYAPIQPPFDLKLREMPVPELKRYYKWFFDIIEERIQELARAVQTTPGFEDWRTDYTPDSLSPLGEWLAQHVETRPRRPEEIKAIEDKLTFPIEIADWELTHETLSLAMDIGMYFGQVLKKNHSALKWEQPLKDRKFVDFGQAVLTGFGQVPLNPVRITTVLARSIADKKKTGTRLRELYSVWEKMISK